MQHATHNTQHATRITYHVSRITHRASRITLWCLILWAAWAVRLWQLDASSLTFDEAATYFVAHRPVLSILTYLRGAVREHPPVYYLLVHLWMNIAGTSEYSLRFFAVGSSMLGIALTARLARALARWLNVTKPVPLTLYTSLPALVLALFPFGVNYARDARMYTLTIVWATLASLCFVPLLFDQDTSRKGWPHPLRLVALVLINALALFTHYYLLLSIISQFVILIILRRWRAWLAWSVAHGLVGLTGVLWLARSPGLSASLSEAWGRFAPAWPTLGQLRRLLADLLFGPIRGVPWPLVYGGGLLVGLGLLAAWRRSRTLGAWLTITSLLPVALAFLMPEPPHSRYHTFLLPFAALALGQLPALVRRSRLGMVLLWLGLSALAVVVLGVYGLPRTVRWIKSNYGHTVETVSAHARPGDGVLFYGPWQQLQFDYYRPDDFPPITSLPPYAPPQLVPEEVEPVLEELLRTYQRLWVIPAAVDEVDPAHFVAGWLDIHAHPVWTTHDFSLYLPPAEHNALSMPVEITFGERLRLERLASDARTVPAGESLRLTLTWTISDTQEGDGTPFDGAHGVLKMELMDERGRGWQQWQVPLGDRLSAPTTQKGGKAAASRSRTFITDRQGLIVPQGAPPGPFTLRMTVIDVSSGVPFPAADTAGPRAQPSVDLFTFDVIEPVAPPVLVDVEDFVGPFTFVAPQGAADMLTLAAYGLGGLRFQQSYPIPLQLHWLAPTGPTPDLELRLQLWHRPRRAPLWDQATPITTATLPLVPDYPVSKWPAGRLVSWPTALQVPTDAPPGRADLTLEVVGADGQPWLVAGRQRLILGTLTVEERSMLREPPAGLNAVQVDFGDQIGLRGYRVDGTARPGGQLDLTYAWYALRRPDRQYAVFNHLLTADGQPITQVDGWPQGGVLLTTQWRPGEYVQDHYTLKIPADAPPGPYLLAVGLYDAANPDVRLVAFQERQHLPNNQWLLRIDGEP